MRLKLSLCLYFSIILAVINLPLCFAGSTGSGADGGSLSPQLMPGKVLDEPSLTSPGHDSKPFYQGRKEGWYWYKKEAVRKKEKKFEPRKRHLPSLSDFTMKELWNMYPDDFQKLLNTFMKKAVQNPTEKNVLEYLTMQDIARRKSVAYASVVSYVEQKHPELSNKTTYPITAPGRAAVVSMRTREIEQTLQSARDSFALIMFSRKGCEFCTAQKSILAYFVDKYGWPVRSIDIDQNPNMAARFNITITPTIIVVEKRSGKYMPVSVGVVSMGELSLRLYRTIRYMRGQITPQQWFMHEYERGKTNDVLTFTKNAK